MKNKYAVAGLFCEAAFASTALAQIPGGGGNSGGSGTAQTVTAQQPANTTYAVSWTGQSVGIAGTVQLGAGTAAIGSVSVSNFPTTQAVSGTVTANLGTLNGAALDTSVQAVKTALGSPFQVGGSIGNTNYPDSVADTALGTPADTAAGTGNGSTIAQLKQLHLDLIAPTPAGTATVGAVNQGAPAPAASAWPVSSIPSTGATMTTSQPQVTSTAAALTFSGSVRRTIYNPAANTTSIFIGASSSVTTTTGWEIPPGASDDLSRFSGTVYAIAASSQIVRLISY